MTHEHTILAPRRNVRDVGALVRNAERDFAFVDAQDDVAGIAPNVGPARVCMHMRVKLRTCLQPMHCK